MNFDDNRKGYELDLSDSELEDVILCFEFDAGDG